MHILALELGGIHKLDMLTSKGEGCHPNVNDTTYVSLCSKLVNEGEEVNNPRNPVNIVYRCPLMRIDHIQLFLNCGRRAHLVV